jgi:hydroxymethylglutaryl-CoA reductase
MVVEEPSVIAAASNACRMIRAGGGFKTQSDEALMIAQIELRDITDLDQAEAVLKSIEAELLQLASQTLVNLVRRGGGPRSLESRRIGPGHLVVHLLVDCQDAMGANLVNSAAEAIGPVIAERLSAKLGLRILSNLCDRRTITVEAEIPATALAQKGGPPGAELAKEIEAASVFAERDPYRASTHNKGIMNGVDSVVIATGNDYRAVEAGVHAYAARSGQYSPLATWRQTEGGLRGTMTLPLALGTVGGTLRIHPGAQLALAISRVASARDLARLAACAGLASNLAALRALSSEGIQRGHMALHARSVAISAGAQGDEVNAVAQRISNAGAVNLAEAKSALNALRSSSS